MPNRSNDPQTLPLDATPLPPIPSVQETPRSLGVDGWVEIQGGPARPAAPCAFSLQTGQHTPGICLDNIYINGLSCDTRLQAGVKLLVLDGTTSHGAEIWGGRRRVSCREDLPGGYFAEHVPEVLVRHWDDRQQREFVLPWADTQLKFSASSPLTVVDFANDLMRKLPGTDGRYLLRLLDGGLRPGILPRYYDNIFLCAHGVRLFPGKNGQEIVVPLKEGAVLPHGVKAKMFNDGFFGGGAFSQQRLIDKTQSWLKTNGIEKVANTLYDLDLVRYGLPLARVLQDVSEKLYEPARTHFRDCRDLPSSGTVMSGLIRLPGDEGVLLFSLGDCLAAAASDNKLVYCSTPIHPSHQNMEPFLGLFRKGADLYRGSKPAGLNVAHFSAEEARRLIFFFCSDGATPGVKGLEKFLRAIKPSLSSAGEIVRGVRGYAEEAAARLAAERAPEIYQPDDVSAAAVEGHMLF